MKLYYFETPNPHKPCAVARYLNSPVEYVRIDLSQGENKTPEFLAINPNGKVPAFSDGDVKLWESPAIMIYLAVKAGSDLWPQDVASQIDAIRWMNWDTAHFSRHAGTLMFNNYIKPIFGLGDPDAAAVEESTTFFRHFAGVLDNHLQNRSYVLGDQLSVADFAIGSFLPSAEKARLPLDGLANIERWHNSMAQLEGWLNPFPAG